MPMMRRRPVMRTVARTAVIAGTATAVAGGVTATSNRNMPTRRPRRSKRHRRRRPRPPLPRRTPTLSSTS